MIKFFQDNLIGKEISIEFLSIDIESVFGAIDNLKVETVERFDAWYKNVILINSNIRIIYDNYKIDKDNPDILEIYIDGRQVINIILKDESEWRL